MDRAREIFESLRTIDDVEQMRISETREGLYLDFKSALNTGGDFSLGVSQSLSSFANSDGGVAIYGVSNQKKGGKGGLDTPGSIECAPQALAGQIRDWAASRVKPPVVGLEIKTLESREKSQRVHVAFVGQSPMRPHQADDKKYHFRNADGGLPADHGYIELLFRTRLSRELAQQPLVVVSEVDHRRISERDTNVTLKNVGNAPALNLVIMLAGQRLGSRGALGLGSDRWTLIGHEIYDALTWSETICRAANESLPLVIQFDDASGMSYEVRVPLRRERGSASQPPRLEAAGQLTLVREGPK